MKISMNVCILEQTIPHIYRYFHMRLLWPCYLYLNHFTSIKSIRAVKSHSWVSHCSVLLIRLPRAPGDHFALGHHRERTWHDCLSRLWQEIYQALQHGTSQKCNAFERWWWRMGWYWGVLGRESKWHGSGKKESRLRLWNITVQKYFVEKRYFIARTISEEKVIH